MQGIKECIEYATGIRIQEVLMDNIWEDTEKFVGLLNAMIQYDIQLHMIFTLNKHEGERLAIFSGNERFPLCCDGKNRPRASRGFCVVEIKRGKNSYRYVGEPTQEIRKGNERDDEIGEVRVLYEVHADNTYEEWFSYSETPRCLLAILPKED